MQNARGSVGVAIALALSIGCGAARAAPSPPPRELPLAAVDPVSEPVVEHADAVEVPAPVADDTSDAGEASAPTSRVVRIGASGDLLAHIRVLASADAHGGFEHVLGPLRAAIHDDELAFLNLETPLSLERPVSSGSPPVLGAPPEVAQVLAAIGIDVVSVANNHAWDQHSIGAGRTLEALAGAHVTAIGAAEDLPGAFAPRVVLTADGTRVAFVGITERVNGGPGPLGPSTLIARWADDASVQRALEQARAEADLVVVSIHWSHDFRATPMRTQRERAQWLVDHGADVILGHGPHVLQEVERLTSPRGEAVCAYSLGNLVSNQGFRYVRGRHAARGAHIATWLSTSRDGVWLRIEARIEEGRVTIAPITGVPLFTYNNFPERERDRHAPEDVRIQLLDDVADPLLRAERWEIIGATLGRHVTLESTADP